MPVFPKLPPLEHQKPFWNYWFSTQEPKRCVLCWHRRSGKDVTCWQLAIAQCLLKPIVLFYVFPSYSQGRKAIWDSILLTGERFLDLIPKGTIQGLPNNQEMKIRFKNGSILQVVGADRQSTDRLRGTNPSHLIFSEFAMADPDSWAFLSPAITRAKGSVVFESTPLGRNHFHNLFATAEVKQAQGEPGWFCQRLTVEDTGLIPKEAIEKERLDGIISEDRIMQEYYCSFLRGSEACYYANYLQAARDEGRVGFFAHNARNVVYTAWDLGWNDFTSIVFFQVDQDGKIFIIDEIEDQFKPLSHYVAQVRSKPYVYGGHFFPHDARNRNIASGFSPSDVASSLDLDHTILGKLPVLSQIENVRSLFPRFHISERCKSVLGAFENYRRQYDEKNKIYKADAVHDKWSHMASAVSYMAMAIQQSLLTSGSSVRQARALFEAQNPIF